MGFLQEWWSIATLFFGRQDKAIEALPPNTSFVGQSIIVTGATSGLGLEAAIIYVQLGAERVYITTRNAARGAEAKSTIEERTGRKDVVRVLILDMDTFDGIENFVGIVKNEIKSIDIVLLNAGLHTFSYQTLPEGWEASLQVNLLSTTLLALLLLPWMQKIKKAGQVQHLTFTGSGSHWTPEIEASEFPKQDILRYHNEKPHYVSGRWQYACSKLLLMYASREIAKLALDDSGSPSPIVNSVCPGMIKTDISRGFRDKDLLHKWIEGVFMWWKASPASEGAKALVVATTTDDHGSFRRPYLTDEQYAEKAKQNVTSTAGQKMQARVWKEIIGVLREKTPDVSEIARL